MLDELNGCPRCLPAHGQCPRYRCLSGFSEAFEARGDVDTIAIDLLALYHYVAQVDPDSKLHPAFGRQSCILGP
jgi:hypothetical protein